MKRRILSTLLTLCLVLGALPGTARTEGSDAQTVINVSTSAQLTGALRGRGKQQNAKIVLEGKDYVITGQIMLDQLENVTIEGTTGTRIVCNSSSDTVFSIWNCKGIIFKNVVLGHDYLPENKEDCSVGVLQIVNSDVTIIDCDIFGCGLDGISSDDSTVNMSDTYIRDCSRSIMKASGSNMTFTNCIFSGNGYKEPSFSALYTYGNTKTVLSFTECTFIDNMNPHLLAFKDGTECPDYSYDDCIFYNNTWNADNRTGMDNVTDWPDITIPSSAKGNQSPAPSKSSLSAIPIASTVLINGENTSFDAYNISGSNYFKLRDLAYVLSGTEKQFEVSWDAVAKAISLTSGSTYTTVGGEMAVSSTGPQTAAPTTSKILLDGREVSLTAYNINGSNYFKLRDIGEAFDFAVEWDAVSKTISIVTGRGYVA